MQDLKNEPGKNKIEDGKKAPSNWKQRVKFGMLLVSLFSYTLYQGPLALALVIFLVQVFCYKEILDIINQSPKLPGFKLTAWYFFTVFNYYLLAETVFEPFKNSFQKDYVLSLVFTHSRFKSFCFHFIGIVIFVISLAGKYDVKRFRMLAILHVLLMFITLPSYLLIKCTLEGMIWAVVPLASVVINDIFAYVFGKLMGKTPLIHVSPNKTWEGFIGGAIGTVISTLSISSLLCNFNFFICPTEYNETWNKIEVNTGCEPMFLFKPTVYELIPGYEMTLFPFTFYALNIALFASLIAPFAGFFASGFKRACNIKDFSNTIPGHGGILDRFDCHFLMAIFVFVYMSTFVKNTKFKRLYGKIMSLSDRDKTIFYSLLQSSLHERGML